MAIRAYIQMPHALMRKIPEEDSSVVSDAIYSEEVTILEEQNDWNKIQTKVDGYPGWVKRSVLEVRPEDYFQGARVAIVSRRMAYIYNRQDTEFGGTPLPFESRVKILAEPEDQQRRWMKVGLVNGSEGYMQRGDVALDAKPRSMQEMVEFSREFLGIPYVWGGRSSFGYDCSGFVQMLYRQMGVQLPRDSKDQYVWQRFVSVEIEEMTPGDLIFFGRETDKIAHVGMYLGNSKFIHSTVKGLKPWIQISSLNDEDWNGSGALSFRASRHLKPVVEKRDTVLRPMVYCAIVGLAMSVALRIFGKSK